MISAAASANGTVIRQLRCMRFSSLSPNKTRSCPFPFSLLAPLTASTRTILERYLPVQRTLREENYLTDQQHPIHGISDDVSNDDNYTRTRSTPAELLRLPSNRIPTAPGFVFFFVRPQPAHRRAAPVGTFLEKQEKQAGPPLLN